jgi:hypothetical protein
MSQRKQQLREWDGLGRLGEWGRRLGVWAGLAVVVGGLWVLAVAARAAQAQREARQAVAEVHVPMPDAVAEAWRAAVRVSTRPRT